MAAQAALLPILQAVDPLFARWERRTSRPADLLVKHRGARWDVRMVLRQLRRQHRAESQRLVALPGASTACGSTRRMCCWPELIRELEAAARRLPE